MIRLIELALLGCLAVRLLSGRWPWELWRDDERKRVERKARSLLGVTVEAGREDIIDAHRRLITQVHPDRGGSNEAVHEANAARDVLLARLGARNAPRA
ncbi:molecular chaperone DnaJ [Novosphingobium sp. FKTRR1]|uniref:molecular chaperone DnaJ n=1 Tax=unclassified Novosphingobium TaxID=2644732 RepID=UPI001CEFD9BA|nr:molecular chaperone DnaJ [Novosphingobium sp. FKTRR1]